MCGALLVFGLGVSGVSGCVEEGFELGCNSKV